MDTTVWLLAIFSYLWNFVKSVPPEVCFANFRWDDCGLPPKAVLYYYKSGARCEVGFWRGCEPNPNMFKDEYECVNTCIFSIRARPEDYHNQQIDHYSLNNEELPIHDNSTDEETTTAATTEDGETTETTNSGVDPTDATGDDGGSGDGGSDNGGSGDRGSGDGSGDGASGDGGSGDGSNSTNTDDAAKDEGS